MTNIVFKKIRFKNVFSYGNTFTEIDYTRSPSTLVQGNNGAGKSVSLLDTLHYALYGTTVRGVKKSKVVNEKNKKDAVIEVTLDKAGEPYTVTRTINPDSLTVKHGENVLDFPNVKATQKYITDTLLGGDKTAFQITTMISKSGIPMFMGLKAEERRRFIDRMLGTAVFTEMRKLQKFDMDAANEKKQDIDLEYVRSSERIKAKAAEIESLKAFNDELMGRWHDERKNSLKASEGVLADLEKQLKDYPSVEFKLDGFYSKLDDCKDRINSLENEVENFESQANKLVKKKIDLLNEQQEAFENTYKKFIVPHRQESDILADLKKCQSILMDTKSSLKSVITMADNLKVGKCPVCLSVADETHIEAEKKKLKKQAIELKKLLDSYLTQEHDLSEELDARKTAEKWFDQFKQDQSKQMADIEAQIAEIVNSQNRCQEKLEAAFKERDSIIEMMSIAKSDWKSGKESLESRIVAARANVEQKKVEVNLEPPKDEKIPKAKKELKALLDSVNVVEKQQKEINTEIEYQKMIAAMLKDGGVKTVIIKRFLPIINTTVNEELASLGFHARFHLDENFQETITYNGHDREFEQFSEGEKLRINVALVLAWRKVARLQGRLDSNLLIWDETLGESLDSDGYEALAEIFKRFEGMNIFIITHNAVKMENFVHSKLQVAKTNGYSRIL